MRRLAILLITCGATIGAAISYAMHAVHDEAWEAARARDAARRAILERLAPERVPASPFIAWVGDSTVLAIGGPSYPFELGRRSKALTPWIVSHFGLEPFGYYFLVSAVLDRDPHAVVFIANLRLLAARSARPETHLPELLPAAELPRAAALPLYTRGWTLPSLLLARLKQHEWFLDAAYLADGVRELWQESEAWAFAGGTTLPKAVSFVAYANAVTQSMQVYDVPLGEHTASVRMLGAAVAMATARGVPAVVVVTPIPWRELEEHGLYRPADAASRIAAIARVVEANGGRVLDLHRLLDADGFRDLGGHLNARGARQMADAVEPTLAALTGGDTAESAPPP